MIAQTLNPGGSSPFDVTALGDALVRRMVAAFLTFRVPNDNPDVVVPEDPEDPETVMPEMFEPVTVYLGSVKGRSRASNGSEIGPAFPMVLVRPRSIVDDNGESGAQRTQVDVDFVIGARRIGNEGFLDVVSIVERIRRDLLVTPIIENRARLELPLESEFGEDDAFPQWFGIVSARFNIPQPIEEPSECALSI